MGITAPSYSSEAMTKSFKDVFGDVLFFDWQYHRFNYGTEGMRSNLLLEVKTYKPDIIFLHLNNHSEALTVDNYKHLSEYGKTIVYTEDVRTNMDWFEKLSPIVELMIFTNIDDVETLKSKGCNNAHYLPVSYNDIWYHKQPKTKTNYGEIVFLANNHVNTNLSFPLAQERQDIISAMKKEFGERFQVYGIGQGTKMLKPQEAVECYNNAKLAISHNNYNRKGYQSDRALNSIGCGCPTIMRYYEGIGKDFPNMFGGFWETIDGLKAICHLYLDNQWMLDLLARMQYDEVSKSHRWINRAESIKELLY